eukprot:scaffold17634_cov75-Phaeocystis_antarctica.AAC.2
MRSTRSACARGASRRLSREASRYALAAVGLGPTSPTGSTSSWRCRRARRAKSSRKVRAPPTLARAQWPCTHAVLAPPACARPVTSHLRLGSPPLPSLRRTT